MLLALPGERIVARFSPYVPPAAGAVLALSPDGCRWPSGAVADADFRFCGAPRVRGAYCAAHARVARRRS